MKTTNKTNVVKKSVKKINDTDLLEMDLDNLNFENLLKEAQNLNSDFKKDKGISENSEKRKLYKIPVNTGIRSKIRKQLTKHISNFLSQPTKDNYISFEKFYLETYTDNSFKEESIIDNRQDDLTQQRNKSFMRAIQLFKTKNKL